MNWALIYDVRGRVILFGVQDADLPFVLACPYGKFLLSFHHARISPCKFSDSLADSCVPFSHPQLPRIQFLASQHKY